MTGDSTRGASLLPMQTPFRWESCGSEQLRDMQGLAEKHEAQRGLVASIFKGASNKIEIITLQIM
jgi:hypothetical protein